MVKSNKHTNRDDIISMFLKGHSHTPKYANTKWSIENNTLHYNENPVAHRNPVTFAITKVSLETLQSEYSGSTLAALVRTLNSIELFHVVDPNGKTLASNLPWIDAIKTKKSLKTNGLQVVAAL